MSSPASPFASPQAAFEPRAAAYAPEAGVPVLDGPSLDRLRELDPSGQNRLLERVFKAFEASVLRLLPQLDAARQGGDWQAVRHVAHTLKSSSASIGAIKLSQLCADIESMVRQSQTEGLPERLLLMQGELAQVLTALRHLQGEAP